MAPSTSDWPSPSSPSRLRCSYKIATILVCASNVLAAVYVLHSLLNPLYLFSSPSPHRSSSLGLTFHSRHSPLRALRYTEEQLNRIKEAVEVWKAAEPVELIKRVKEIQEESVAGAIRYKQANIAREKVASDLAQRLKELRAGSQSEQEALEEWRKKKIEEAKMREHASKIKQGDVADVEADDAAEEMVKVLETAWGSLLEEAGWSGPGDTPNRTAQQNATKTQDFEIEDGIIPGRPMPPECHAEPHTDYDGAAVRWGLTHRKESAADCCMACLDQARTAKPGQMQCNIWVYCPAEKGCYSPDMYEHKHQECWLKQADQPRLNFKGKYDPEYRKQHPTAPVVVPWASGVITG